MSKPLSPSPLPLALAALLTFGFVGCMSETRSLNDIEAGNGGEEGDTPGAGTGGRAGTGSNPAGSAGLYPNETGGTGGASTAGTGGLGFDGGGTTNGGFGGDAITAGRPQGGAGSPNGGVPNAGSGALAGFAGSAGGPVAGGAGAPACDSSDGSGCSVGSTFCVDNPLDTCAPDVDSSCSGYCAQPYAQPTCSGFSQVACPEDFECVTEPDSLLGTDPYGICIGDDPPECQGDEDCGDGFKCTPAADSTKRCSPRRADCHPVSICDVENVPVCPIGYAPAAARTCSFVCIPYEQCGCTLDADCVAPSVCDRLAGRCRAVRAPEPRCMEPWDAGPCDASVPAFAFFSDDCKPVVYGGCEGNDNRFTSREECQRACMGMPLERSCPDGTLSANGCLECGLGGGCINYGNYCFAKCEKTEDCDGSGSGFGCIDGICQRIGCI